MTSPRCSFPSRFFGRKLNLSSSRSGNCRLNTRPSCSRSSTRRPTSSICCAVVAVRSSRESKSSNSLIPNCASSWKLVTWILGWVAERMRPASPRFKSRQITCRNWRNLFSTPLRIRLKIHRGNCFAQILRSFLKSPLIS